MAKPKTTMKATKKTTQKTATPRTAAKTRMSRSIRPFRERYGPAALVTGAAQGIGRAFADALAARGLDVYLLDVQREPVARAAAEVAERFGVAAMPVVVDLSRRDCMDAIRAAVPVDEIGLVVCNAALGQEGGFLEADLDSLHRAIDVACHATVSLLHGFGRAMAARGRGGLVVLASGTALQGSPRYANYGATKAFNLVLGESLWYELRDHGVDVLAFVPGPTNTPGLRSTVPGLKEGVAVGPIRLPGETAEAAVRALGRAASASREKDLAVRLAVRRRRADVNAARDWKSEAKPGGAAGRGGAGGARRGAGRETGRKKRGEGR